MWRIWTGGLHPLTRVEGRWRVGLDAGELADAAGAGLDLAQFALDILAESDHLERRPMWVLPVGIPDCWSPDAFVRADAGGRVGGRRAGVDGAG